MEEEKESEVVSGKANLGLTHRKSQKHKLQIKFSYLLRPQGQPFIPYQEASPVAQRVPGSLSEVPDLLNKVPKSQAPYHLRSTVLIDSTGNTRIGSGSN